MLCYVAVLVFNRTLLACHLSPKLPYGCNDIAFQFGKMDSQPKSPSDQVRRPATVAKHISGSTVEFCLSTGKIGILGANKRHSFVPFMCLLGI